MRNARHLISLLLLLLSTGATAAAQVGHTPGDSPYRDIRRGHTVTFLAGHIGGDGGRFGIGPHDGDVFGARYDIRTSRPLQFGLGIMHGQFDRLIVDPFVQPAQRVSGPVEQSLTFAEFSLQFNLTGGKSWHRLAPFVRGGMGIAFASSTPADTSDFAFGRKFFFAPTIGTRIFVTNRIHLRAEARTVFWKLSYPASFQLSTPDNPNAVITDSNTSEWTTSPWLQLGIGYGFSP